ncbi:MAG: zinc-binding alcohol dehydrogenase family protein [Caulobacteraceae bacterium]|nr:zinc-binding alcohol dehydrogenase family protein [Caulobacteraceae bacterium]
MRAIAQESFGGPEVLRDMDLPIPEVTGSDLRVRVHAVAVNPVDVKVRTDWGGFGQLQPGKPVVTGWDAAGVVDAVGPDADGRFKPGDAVFFAGSVSRAGHHREYTLVDSRQVGRKPSRIGFAEAAALPLTSLTVWEGMFQNAGLPVEAADVTRRVMVIGGAGGVGSIAIQILKRVAGMQVVATASRELSRSHCLALGADHVISHAEPLAPQLSAIGVDALDAVLHTSEPDGNIEEVFALMAPFGKIVCILPVDKPIATGSLFARSVSLVYELMFTKGLFQVGLAAQGAILDRIADLVDAGTLQSTLVDRYPWTVEGLRAAHDRIEGRKGLGKAVLSIIPD